MMIVDVEKKLKAYSGAVVLKVNKEFAPGTITRITGPSGAGKTTFLKMIAGLIKPDAGLIQFDNSVWFDAAAGVNLSPQQRRPGFVFQDYALFPNMTVEQHLRYVTTDSDWINKLLRLGKLEAFSSHKPVHLSGGQQQRLAILRALALKPELLLMDEPFSALDLKTKTELISDLKVVFEELKITVIIVSHNPQELEAVCDDELEIGTDSSY